MLIQGDYDAIGKKGSNKVEIDGELYGIDFGHAYRKKNTLIDTLLPNLHLPISTVREYPNFSIFFDAKRSELMKGMLIYATLMGIQLPESLLTQYDERFQQKLKGLEVGSIEKLFSDYINYFTHRANNEPEYVKHYLTIIEKIKSSKDIVDDTIKNLLTKIKDKIDLPPQVHDIIESLEKISLGKEGTSRRSPDGQVLLNHIRLLNDEIAPAWTATYQKDQYTFSATFPTSESAQAALSRIQQFDPELSITQGKKRRQLIITYTKNVLQDLSSRLNEENIKQKYHETDYKYFRLLKKEQKLNDLVAKLSNKLPSTKLVLTFTEIFDNEIQYLLTLKEKNGHESIDGIIEKLQQFDKELLDEGKTKSSETIIMPKRQTKEESDFTLPPPKIEDSSVKTAPENNENEKERRKKLVIIAIKEENIEGLRALFVDGTLSIDDSIDQKNNTALHLAVKENKPEIVKYLVKEMNADALIKNNAKEMALVLSFSPSSIELGKIIFSNIGLFSYVDKSSSIYQEVADEMQKFENPSSPEVKSSVLILSKYGEKLIQRAGMHWFRRFITGIGPNLQSRIFEFGEYCYSIKQVQIEYNPLLFSALTLQPKRGALGKSALHDDIELFKDYYFTGFPAQDFARKLELVKANQDTRLQQLEKEKGEANRQRKLLEDKIEAQSTKIEAQSEEIKSLKENMEKNVKKYVKEHMKELFQEFLLEQATTGAHPKVDSSSNSPSSNPGLFK